MSSTPLWNRGTILVAGFTAAYVALSTPWALLSGNNEFIFYILILVVMAALIGYLHARVRLSLGALWCLSLWGLAHMAGGLVPVPEGWPINGDVRVLYSMWFVEGLLKYDHVVHAFGFGVTTWVCWQCLRSLAPNVEPRFGPLFLCVAAGMGFGALNEVIEFAATLMVPETNVGGYINTGWDLVSNMVGASTAALAIALLSEKTRG